MATFTFEEYYGSPYQKNNYVSFEIELNESQEQELRAFLKDNGPCDYCYLERCHSELFNLINDTANESVAKDICSRLQQSLEDCNIDWSGIYYDFFWDKRLLD